MGHAAHRHLVVAERGEGTGLTAGDDVGVVVGQVAVWVPDPEFGCAVGDWSDLDANLGAEHLDLDVAVDRGLLVGGDAGNGSVGGYLGGPRRGAGRLLCWSQLPTGAPPRGPRSMTAPRTRRSALSIGA